MDKISKSLTFDDNYLLTQLLGDGDEYLVVIEKAFDLSISCRGEVISLLGEEQNVKQAEELFKKMYQRLKNDEAVSLQEIEAGIRFAQVEQKLPKKNENSAAQINKKNIVFKTLKKSVTPYTVNQAEYMHYLHNAELVFGTGPAGTGKTYIAVAAAVSLFLEDKIDRIILSRPAVEAGESLGFLPGGMQEKVDPYLRPLYDALNDMMPAEKVMRCMQTGQIEIAPLAFMRGRTLRHCAVILDEAQNATPVQMKMFLTRLGEGCRMFVTGDLSQTDLPKGKKSGLRDAIEKLSDIDEIKMIYFNDRDSVRHELTSKIIKNYEKYDKNDQWKS